jgi:ubiquinol-cytochrome c reductase cytochrome b subunit
MLVFDCAILLFVGKYAPESYWLPFAFEIADSAHFTELVVANLGLEHSAAINEVGEMFGVNFASGHFGIKILRLGQFATIFYFAHFFVFLPLLSIFETPRPLPLSISRPVLGGGAHAAAGAPAKPMEKAR